MHPLPLRTPSLLLRHLVPEDSQPMLRLNAEETTRRWLPAHVYADVREAADQLAYLIASYSTPCDPRLGPYVLAVEHGGTGQLLGHVGFGPARGEVEVSYAISEPARRNGYGTEAVVHACAWAAGAFALGRILAITASANTPSRRLLERAGFRYLQSERTRFQGAEELVCIYEWVRPGGATLKLAP